ncbi:MAG: GNAT family N-acetyltransferase [Acidimicrobiales bacterium]
MSDTTGLLRAYDSQLRPAEAAGLPDGVHAETDGPVTRVVGWHRGFVSTPNDLGLAGEALDALIARQRDFFAARDEAVEWKTRGHDRPPELFERLVLAGFVPEATETVVVGTVSDLASLSATPPDGVVLRQVTAGADMDRIAAMESRVWGADRSWLATELRTGADNGAVVVLAAEAAGHVVSAAWLEWKPGTPFAALWGGSTVPAWRRQGIYRALVARRAALAAERGVRYLQVDASDDSRPILERLGFTAITTTTAYVWTPRVPRHAHAAARLVAGQAGRL